MIKRGLAAPSFFCWNSGKGPGKDETRAGEYFFRTSVLSYLIQTFILNKMEIE
jgi:hypothetical protein